MKKCPKPARGLVVDDHAIVRVGLVQVLQSDPRFVVCGEAVNALEVRQRIAACRGLQVDTSTYHYRSRHLGQAVLEHRIKEIYQTRVRYGTAISGQLRASYRPTQTALQQ